MAIIQRTKFFMCVLVIITGGIMIGSAGSSGVETVFGPSERSLGNEVLLPTSAMEYDSYPFSCWSCNSTDENDGCFNLTEEYRTESRKQLCPVHETYCRVQRVWYIFGTNRSEYNFSIYRNCSATCEPYCVIMGDRTKVYSCATCCQDSFCNTGSTSVEPFKHFYSLSLYVYVGCFHVIQSLMLFSPKSLLKRIEISFKAIQL